MPFQRPKPQNKRQINPHSLSLPNTEPLQLLTPTRCLYQVPCGYLVRDSSVCSHNVEPGVDRKTRIPQTAGAVIAALVSIPSSSRETASYRTSSAKNLLPRTVRASLVRAYNGQNEFARSNRLSYRSKYPNIYGRIVRTSH